MLITCHKLDSSIAGSISYNKTNKQSQNTIRQMALLIQVLITLSTSKKLAWTLQILLICHVDKLLNINRSQRNRVLPKIFLLHIYTEMRLSKLLNAHSAGIAKQGDILVFEIRPFLQRFSINSSTEQITERIWEVVERHVC